MNNSVGDQEIQRAVEMLRSAGAREIFLFGSRSQGAQPSGADLDLAVRGVPAPLFFEVLGRLMEAISCPVDLVDLDGGTPFARFLESRGELLRVG